MICKNLSGINRRWKIQLQLSYCPPYPILEFASKNRSEVGGKKVWKVLQDSGAIPNRTYESLRTRYHRYLKKD